MCFFRRKTILGVLDVMTLKMKFYLSSSCWWRKKPTVRRRILEFSQVWTPWALSIGWKIREGSRIATDYIGKDKWKEWLKEVEECQKRRMNEELQKTEERIGKGHRKSQERISWKHTWRHEISKNRTLWFNVPEDKVGKERMWFKTLASKTPKGI